MILISFQITESYEMKCHARILIMIHPDYRKYVGVNYILFMLSYNSAKIQFCIGELICLYFVLFSKFHAIDYKQVNCHNLYSWFMNFERCSLRNQEGIILPPPSTN